jgi:hypothetical protein
MCELPGTSLTRGADMESNIREVLAGFRSSASDPRHCPDPYVLRQLAGRVEGGGQLGLEYRLDPRFIREMQALYLEGFRRLDALPRDDPFWEGTNRRPTPGKMRDFCDKARRDNPGDLDALRILAAVLMMHGLFDHRVWERLLSAGQVEPAWSVYAALLAGSIGGGDTWSGLLVLLKELGLLGAVRSTLEDLRRSGHPVSSAWAGEVTEGYLA